jgi:hypothetical protein
MVALELSIWKLKKERRLMNYSFMILTKIDGWTLYFTGMMKRFRRML